MADDADILSEGEQGDNISIEESETVDGQEETVDVEEVEMLSRNELDDEAFSGSELDDETVNGGELDDSDIGENETVVNNPAPAVREKEKKSMKRFMLFGGLGLFTLVLIAGLVIGRKLFHTEKPLEKKPAAIMTVRP